MSDENKKGAEEQQPKSSAKADGSLSIENLDEVAGGRIPAKIVRNGDPCDGSE